VTPADSLVTRLDGPFQPPIDIGLPTGARSPLAVASTLGPFPGIVGDFRIELHSIVSTLAVYHSSFATPVLVLTRREAPLAAPARLAAVDLAGGTIWILARALVAHAPEGAYVGVTVSGGRVELVRPGQLDGAKVTIDGAFDLTLTAVPTDRRTPSAARGAAASMKPPAQLSIRWTNGSARVDAGAGEATFYGRHVAFDGAVQAFKYAPELQALTLPCAHASPDRIDLNELLSPLVTADGVAQIAGAWLLSLYTPSDPTRWSEASGPGTWGFALDSAVSVRWLGGTRAVRLEAAHVVVDHGQFWLVSRQVGAPGVVHELSLWSGAAEDRVKARLELIAGSVFAFGSDEAADSVSVSGAFELPNERPVDVAGRPLTVGSAGDAVLTLATGTGTDLEVHVRGVRALAAGRRSLLLRNALLAVTDPVAAALAGRSSDGRAVVTGECRVVVPCFGWLPALPDPYVSSAAPIDGVFQGSAGRPRAVHAAVAWAGDGAPRVSFTGDLAPPTVKAEQPSPPQQLPQLPPNPATRVRVPTQAAQGRAPVQKFSSPRRDPQRDVDFMDDFSAVFDDVKDEWPRALAARDAAAGAVVPRPADTVRLLDVSGAKDFIGVTFGTTKPATFSVRDADVITPLSNVGVLMLPQVQWEPLRTLAIDQNANAPFPERLLFHEDGGPTSVFAGAATLVTSVPNLVVDAVLQAHREDHAPVTMVTTLPFGLGATLLLTSKYDTLELKTPAFGAPGVRGATQLAVSNGEPEHAGRSSSFAGNLRQTQGFGVFADRSTVLRATALDAFTPAWQPDTETSAAYFVGRDFSASVPVTRLDVSGRGGSCFSVWNDSHALGQVGKVELRVLVGRCALEVVKVVSVLHPWGILVTRTVTIERRAGGGVVRRDSGWQAASDGVFRFPVDSNNPSASYPYPVEPGLFRGFFDVRNIRVTGGAPIAFEGQIAFEGKKTVTLVPLLFDARAEIKGLDGGAKAEAVLGFLQLDPEGAGHFPSAEDLAKVFDLLRDPVTDDLGTIGGRVDAELSLAGSPFRFRARRIEVGMRDGATLVGVVRGTPVFEQSGAWGVARRSRAASTDGSTLGSATEASHVEDARGTPIVAAGVLDKTQSTPKTIALLPVAIGAPCFRDPEDLHKQPTDARREYGLLHSSPAHAFFYPDPCLSPLTTPATHIRSASGSPPELADAFARTTTRGVFPSREHVLTLDPFTLPLSANGSFSSPGEITWRPPSGKLRLPVDSGGSTHIEYVATPLDAPATLRLSFDDTRWSLRAEPLNLWTDAMGVPDAFRTLLRIHAGSDERPMLLGVETHFGEALGDVLNAFAWLLSANPPPKDIDLTATNADPLLFISAGYHGTIGEGATRLEIGAEVGCQFFLDRTPALRIELELGATFGMPWHAECGAKVEYFTQAEGGRINDVWELTVYVGGGVGNSSARPPGLPSAPGSDHHDSGEDDGPEVECGLDVIAGLMVTIEPPDPVPRFFIEADGCIKISKHLNFLVIQVSAWLALSAPIHASTWDELRIGDDGRDLFRGAGHYLTGWAQITMHIDIFFCDFTAGETAPLAQLTQPD
jgi:hypothetical protein